MATRVFSEFQNTWSMAEQFLKSSDEIFNDPEHPLVVSESLSILSLNLISISVSILTDSELSFGLMKTTVGGVESLVVKYHVSPSKEDSKGLPARSVISSNLSLTLCSFPDPRPFEALKTLLVEVVVIAPSMCSPPMETINVAELILPCSIASENVTLTSEFSSTSESLFPGFMEDKFGESKSMEVKSMFTSSSVSTPSFPPSLVSSFKEDFVRLSVSFRSSIKFGSSIDALTPETACVTSMVSSVELSPTSTFFKPFVAPEVILRTIFLIFLAVRP